MNRLDFVRALNLAPRQLDRGLSEVLSLVTWLDPISLKLYHLRQKCLAAVLPAVRWSLQVAATCLWLPTDVHAAQDSCDFITRLAEYLELCWICSLFLKMIDGIIKCKICFNANAMKP